MKRLLSYLWIAVALTLIACSGSSGSGGSSTEVLSPVRYSGEGDDVVDCSAITGKAYKTATLTHDGERNFIVRPIDASGNEMVSLANEIGQYAGTVTWNRRADSLSVRATGKWTIEVR